MMITSAPIGPLGLKMYNNLGRRKEEEEPKMEDEEEEEKNMRMRSMRHICVHVFCFRKA